MPKTQINLRAAWKWRRAMMKGEEGRPLARELAALLNYNLSHGIDPDRRILPEPPKTSEEAFLSRLRQADEMEAAECIRLSELPEPPKTFTEWLERWLLNVGMA